MYVCRVITVGHSLNQTKERGDRRLKDTRNYALLGRTGLQEATPLFRGQGQGWV